MHIKLSVFFHFPSLDGLFFTHNLGKSGRVRLSDGSEQAPPNPKAQQELRPPSPPTWEIRDVGND